MKSLVKQLLRKLKLSTNVSRIIQKQSFQNGNIEIPNRGLQVINESGLYELILSSHAPLAEEFQDWVTEEVLPTIRKQGAYLTTQAIEKIVDDPENFVLIVNKWNEERKVKEQVLAEKYEEVLKRLKAEKKIEVMQPKTDYYDKVLNSSDTQTVTAIAKSFNMTAIKLNSILHKEKVQYKNRYGQWFLYAQHQNKGYIKTRTTYNYYGELKHYTVWTEKGKKFIYNLLLDKGYIEETN